MKLSADGSSWTTALALQANGRAGLGTASPTAHLEIQGGSDDYLLAGSGSADFRLGSDGNGSCSGAWSGGGADYAEWFEWADGNPAVIGDGDIDGWEHRWLRDDYGSLLRDADGQPRPNPAHDPDRPYVPRSQRPEWALVGQAAPAPRPADSAGLAPHAQDLVAGGGMAAALKGAPSGPSPLPPGRGHRHPRSG